MSITDDNTLDDGGLTAEEQAQFDSMRDPGSNASSPAQLVDPAEQPVDKITPAADAALKTPEPAAQGEADDPDVETIKDASGADVIDAKTGKPQKRVSFHKYQRLEQRYNDLELKFGKTAEERARIDERLKIINEALTTPAPVAEEPVVDQDPRPDPEVNIFEYVKWQERQIDREREARTSLEQSWKDEREEGQMASSYRQDANRFASSEPNFGRAYHFLLTLRANQLRAGGWDDQTKIDQQIVKEERGLVRKAIQEKAKAAGFVAPNPEEERKAAEQAEVQRRATEQARMTDDGAKVPGALDGAVRPAAAAAAKSDIPTVSEQVALAAQGAEAALSLSSAGGAPVEQLTAAKLLTMDEDSFNEAVAGMSKSKLREIFGD